MVSQEEQDKSFFTLGSPRQLGRKSIHLAWKKISRAELLGHIGNRQDWDRFTAGAASNSAHRAFQSHMEGGEMRLLGQIVRIAPFYTLILLLQPSLLSLQNANTQFPHIDHWRAVWVGRDNHGCCFGSLYQEGRICSPAVRGRSDWPCLPDGPLRQRACRVSLIVLKLTTPADVWQS